MLDPHMVMIYLQTASQTRLWLHMTSKLVNPMGMMYHTNNLLHKKNYITWSLTLILLTLTIGWGPNNASKWQMEFNSAFKGLNTMCYFYLQSTSNTSTHIYIQQFGKSSPDKGQLMVKTFQVWDTLFIILTYQCCVWQCYLPKQKEPRRVCGRATARLK
jgi:hypothetical protein